MPKHGFFVKNILILGDQNGKNGEYRSSINQSLGGREIIFNDGLIDNTRVNRIVEQIKSLGEFAKEHSKPQQLTRLVTDEFSFYTKNTPLSIDEYKEIINNSYAAFSTLPPNIALIISSMPVLWPDGSLRNALLHIQSPNNYDSKPIIHHFSKEYCSIIDPVYSKDNTTANVYEFHSDDYDSAYYSPNVVLKDSKITCNDPNQYKSAILVQGLNIPPIIDAIEVCYDHFKGVAINNTEQLLKNTAMTPLYISHIVSSNSLEKLNPDNTTSSVVQADWKFKKVEGVSEKKNDLLNTVFGTQSLAYIYKAKKADLLHSYLFELSRKGMITPITDIVDTKENTLLHESFFLDKTANSQQIFRNKQIDTFIAHCDDDSVNRQNNEGNTPLHLAISTHTDKNLIIKLLEKGARFDIKNKKGLSPLALAQMDNQNELIILLCNQVIDNKKIFIKHRQTIFNWIDELTDVSIKNKLIKKILHNELSMPNPEKNTVLGLLKALNFSSRFIQNNFSKLVALAGSNNTIYSDLISLLETNELHMSKLSYHERILLLKQEISQKNVSDARIHFLLTGYPELQNQFATNVKQLGYEELFQCLPFLPLEMRNPSIHTHPCIGQSPQAEIVNSQLNNDLTLDEQTVAIAYLAKDPKLLEKPYLNLKELSPISIRKIAEFCHNRQQGNINEVITWIKQERIKYENVTAVKLELNKGINSNADVILHAYKQGINVNANSGLSNGLTIGEATIIYGYTTQNKDILKAVYNEYKKRGMLPINYSNITQVFINPKASPEQNKATLLQVSHELATKLLEFDPGQILLNEFSLKQHASPYVILNALKQPINLLTNCPYGVSYGELAITLAYLTKNSHIFAQVYAEFKALGALPINTDNIARLFPENEYHEVNNWIDQRISNLDFKSLLNNELSNPTANPTYIITLLSHGKEVWNTPYQLQEITLAEQAIIQAYKTNNHHILEKVFFEYKNAEIPQIDVQKISKRYKPQEKNLFKDWLIKSLAELDNVATIKDEFHKGKNANPQVLDKYLGVIQLVSFDTDCGLNNGLTIAEQAIAQAYLVRDSRLFTLMCKKTMLDAERIEKIARSLINPELTTQGNKHIMQDVRQWMTQELDNLNPTKNLGTDYGLNNNLTSMEQCVVNAYKATKTISDSIIFKPFHVSLTDENINNIAQSLVNPSTQKSINNVKIEIYQSLLWSEFNKDFKSKNANMILQALSKGQDVWSKINKDTGLNYAEHAVSEAFLLKESKIIRSVYDEFTKAGVDTINAEKISSIWLSTEQKQAGAEWINNELAKIENERHFETITNEMQKDNFANKKLMYELLFKDMNFLFNEGIGLLINLLRNPYHSASFQKFLKNHPEQMKKLGTPRLFQHFSIPYLNDLFPFYLLSSYVEGLKFLLNLLEMCPNLSQTITGEDLCKQRITKVGKSFSTLDWLVDSIDGIYILDHLFKTNLTLAKTITRELLCRSRADGSSILFNLIRNDDCFDILENLLNDNLTLAKSITGEALCRPITNSTDEDANSSILYWLCEDGKGTQILSFLIDNNPELMKYITGDVLCRQLYNITGPNNNTSLLIWLTSSTNGRNIMLKLLTNNPGLARTITEEALCNPCNTWLGLNDHTSPFYFLSENEEGVQILIQLLANNTELVPAITPDVLCRHSDINNSALNCLTRTSKGRAFLKQLFCQNPELVQRISKEEWLRENDDSGHSPLSMIIQEGCLDEFMNLLPESIQQEAKKLNTDRMNNFGNPSTFFASKLTVENDSITISNQFEP